MRRLRFLSLTAFTLAALVAVAGAQVVTTPGGGAAMPVTIVGTADVNVLNWGGAALSIGQQLMAGSIPVTIASNQSALPVTFPALQDVNVSRWGGTLTTLGQKTMSASVPVTMASDQTALLVAQSPEVASNAQGIDWFRATGVLVSNQDIVFLNDYTVLVAADGASGRYSLDRGHTFANTPNIVNEQFVSGMTGGPNIPGQQGIGIALVSGVHNAGAGTQALWRTINSGQTWSTIILGNVAGKRESCSPGIAPTGTAIIHSEIGSFRSTNFGATWSAVDAVNRCGFGFIMNGNTIYLGSGVWVSTIQNGGVIRSTDDGLTWTSVLATGGTSARVTGLTPSILLAIADSSASIWRSTDGGTTWGAVATLPGNPKAIQGLTATIAVAHESTRVWRSLDAGFTWAIANTTFFTVGCSAASCTDPTAVNSLGDVVEANNQGGGIEQIAYSSVFRSWERVLVSGNGSAVGTSTNPLRVDPTGTTSQPVTLASTTANQGTAAASGATAWPVGLVQGPTLFNSQTTGAANTAVTVTIAAAANVRAHLYQTYGYCGIGGTSSLTVTDGGTTIWATEAAEVTTVRFEHMWTPGLTSTTNSALVVTLAACGGGITGTLHVQADRF